MSSKTVEKVLAETLDSYTIQLRYKSWSLVSEANQCILGLFCGEEEILVDGKTPELDLRLSPPLVFGSSQYLGAQSVLRYLQSQVRSYVEALLKDVRFKVRVHECRAPAVWVSLELSSGDIPRGVSLPHRLETSVLSLLPKESSGYAAYLEITNGKSAIQAPAAPQVLAQVAVA